MRILALNPHHGGSHRSFLEQWVAHSEHEWELLTLPGRHWKWRMHQAAFAFAQQVEHRVHCGARWDLVWCTAMLNLAELRGICSHISELPVIVYMHENQFAYPVREGRQKDLRYGMINAATAMAADEIWWNSQWNQHSFCDGLRDFLGRMPRPGIKYMLPNIEQRSKIAYPGIESWSADVQREPGTSGQHLVWAARWEHDKRPKMLADALDLAHDRGIPWTLSLLGQRYSRIPDGIESIRCRHASRLRHVGAPRERSEYWRILASADTFVSTANHEFFGLSVLEAAATGCVPLVPHALAYPEVLEYSGQQDPLFYDDSAQGLCNALEQRAGWSAAQWKAARERVSLRAAEFSWDRRARELDRMIETHVSLKSSG